MLRPIKHLWQLWRSFKQVQRGGDDLKCCFQVWRAFQSFKKQKKVVQKAGRESRKAKVDTLLNEAATAASRQDMRGLYQLVRKLAPKQEYKRVQIHSKQGMILTPGEEIEELKVFFTNVYSGETYTMEFETPCEIPSVEALESALCKVRTVKAVPTGCAPAALWKHCAPVLAKHLHQLLSDLWDGRAPTVPQLWKDCWITLLAKPGKRIAQAPRIASTYSSSMCGRQDGAANHLSNHQTCCVQVLAECAAICIYGWPRRCHGPTPCL